MHALKTASFLKPASRPSSPTPTPASSSASRPDSAMSLGHLTRLGLSNFKRSSTPVAPPSPLTQTTLVQDGSYLEAVSLKLSEAGSKALTQPTGPAVTPNELLNGRRPIPVGRGRAFGTLIAGELNACRGNPHLYRALLRLLQRPLTVMLTNLSSQLLPLLSSPAFLNPPAPSVQNPLPNPTQTHALALASFAGELLETFDQLGLGVEVDPRGEGLKTVRDGLLSLVGRVANPLISGIKREILPFIEALEAPASVATGFPPAVVKTTTSSATTKANAGLHPSVISLQASVPIYARALARYTTSQVTQASLASFLISIIWRALVAFAHRPILASPPVQVASTQSSPLLGSVPPSPTPTGSTLMKRLNSSTTPPTTPPPSRFTLKLPPSRPPSPPSASTPNTAADARALYNLLQILPRPADDTEANKLAREAVDEAFEGFAGLCALLEFLASHTLAEAKELEQLTEDIPVLIALPVLLQTISGTSRDSPATILGLSEVEYRETCLAGFGRAEECAPVVAEHVLRVVGVEKPASPVVRWLQAHVNATH